MECRSHWYEKLLSAADSILVCAHGKPIQKQLRYALYVHHMTSTLAVSELYYLAEYAYHHTVVFIFFIHLVADKGNKSALFCIKLNGIEHTLIHNA